MRGNVPLLNPVVNYRWSLDGVAAGYQWLNGEGLHARDVTDAADFRLSAYPAPPAWAQDAILYQIFPDRFAKSTDRLAPDWAIPQRWDDPVVGNGPETPYQLYGGDLDGITAHLDHIARHGRQHGLSDAGVPGPIESSLRRHRLRPASIRCSGATRLWLVCPTPCTPEACDCSAI